MGILEDPKFWQEKQMTLKLDLTNQFGTSKVVKCGRTCVVCDQLNSARTHAHRTHVLEVFSHAHAQVRPHIARVRARTHLCNSYLDNNTQIKSNMKKFEFKIIISDDILK